MVINKCGCGGAAVAVVEPLYGMTQYIIQCTKCGCRTTRQIEKSMAICIWNTAHPDVSELQKRIAELEKQYDILNMASCAHKNDHRRQIASKDERIAELEMENATHKNNCKLLMDSLQGSMSQWYGYDNSQGEPLNSIFTWISDAFDWDAYNCIAKAREEMKCKSV